MKLHADEGLIAEADASGTLQRNYGWKPDHIFGMEPQWLRDHNLGQTAYFVNDHTGAPIRLMNKRGEIVWRGDYNSLGLFTADTTLQAPANVPGNATPANPPFALIDHNLRRPGQYEDTEAGLYNNWNRYFDPTTGRYISQDPMGLSEGPNQYNYADQNGQNMIDPEGKVIVLIPIIIWAWRIYEVYDLYAQVRDGCFDMKQFLIDRIPVGKLFKHVKWKRKPGPKPKEPPRCPLPGSNSFTGDTLVHIWDEANQAATTKPIKDIRLGDKVLAYAEWATANDTDAEGSPLPALRIEPVSDIYSSHKQQTLVTLTLDNGETIHATAGHPFKTAAGWRDATLLNVGTQIVSKDGVGEGSARNADGKPSLFANAVNRTKQAIAGTVASLATAAVMAVSPVAEVGTPALAQNQIQEQVQPQTPALVRGLADIETERYRTVVAVTKQTEVVPVYNLEVASAHTFFVGEEGVLVHNQNCKRRISPEKILSPPIERGKAPIGMDNQPIELHHLDGDTVIEMTQEDHRGKGNYNKNHDRKKPIKPKRNPRKHWCDEWDSGRWSD